MSDKDNTVDPGKAPEDAVGNLKQEVNRKIGNIDDRLAKVAQMNADILAQLQAAKEPPKPAPAPSAGADMDSLIYDNPKEFARLVKEEAKVEAMQELKAQQDAVNQIQVQQQDVLTKLVQDYPELSDANHPMTQRTMKIYQSMSEQDKQLPMSYRAAAFEAAAEMGLSPKSVRNDDDDDDFTLGGSRGGRKKPTTRSKDDDAMLQFAAHMGVDINDKKQVERLKARRDRNYKKYE